MCRQLGLGRGGSTYGSRMSAKGLFFFNGVHCTGSENELAQCPSNGVFRGATDTCSSVFLVSLAAKVKISTKTSLYSYLLSFR